MSAIETDVRCPVGAQTLLMKVLSQGGGAPLKIQDQRMQLHCKECSRDFKRINDKIQRVLHVYTMSGDFEYTQIQFKDGDEKSLDVATQVKILKLSTAFTRPRS